MSYETKEREMEIRFQYSYETYIQKFYIVPSLGRHGQFTSGLLAWACDPNTDKKTVLRILHATQSNIARSTARYDVLEVIQKGLIFRKRWGN